MICICFRRNPCVLSSDIRKLRARQDVPADFKSLYPNVLVFPARGPDSHANECAGGDLDGDLYYVVWDKRLIPANLPIPGKAVVTVNTIEYGTIHDGGSDLDMMKFYTLYQQQNNLGEIANAHLATSDRFGIESEEATKVARYVVAETDAPKKGYTVTFDRKTLKPKEYPHYMRKVDRDTYYSKTIVGKLFDESLSVLDIISEGNVIKQPNKCPMITCWNHALVDYWYSLYCCQIQSLLKSFNLLSEADLFSGCPIWRKDFRSDFKKRTRVKETLDDTMSSFWKKWQRNFEVYCDKVRNDPESIEKWYLKPKSHSWPASSFSLLALPHLKNSMHTKKKLPINAAVQQSLMDWISVNKLNWIDDWNKRKSIGETIFSYLDNGTCDFYGSSMLGLSEDFSDIDLYTSSDLTICAAKLRALDENACERNVAHRCVAVTFDSHSAELTNFGDGVLKTYSIAKCFDENPHLWAALRVLLEWARTNKVSEVLNFFVQE